MQSYLGTPFYVAPEILMS